MRKLKGDFWHYIPRFLRFRKFMLCMRVFWGRSERAKLISSTTIDKI